ncbi:MAG: hypothetical protein JW716_05650, partial [Candidatus Aenigmarchaeota archaeon]|nr:hypothetical protein [Candidatus Aenigmarchaeota archaeon]
TFTIRCNISDNATAQYNITSDNYEDQTLVVAVPGEDTTPPQTIIYSINDTSLFKGDDVLVYAQWDDLPHTALAEYNSTMSAFNTYQISTPYTNNWTNHTLDTNASWIPGKHYVKLYANDSFGNMNSTLQYLTFDLWGNARVTYMGPTGNRDRGELTVTCRVTDDGIGSGIGNYTVNFYDEYLNYMGTNETNTTGYAQLKHDFSEYEVGPQTLYCVIGNELSMYYYAVLGGDQATGSPTLYGYLNTSIILPALNSNFMKGQTVQLNTTTKDENLTTVSPPTVLWYNTTSQIASGENTTWVIPSLHSTGPETIIVNSSNQYYYNGTNTTTIYVWGYSNITWNSPPPGTTYSQGTNVTLRCDVKDANTSAGIENYTVSFYVANSTNVYYIGNDDTSSTGLALQYWDATGFSIGEYYPKCNITSDADVYYNATSSNQANTTINISEATTNAWLSVTLETPPTILGDGNATEDIGYLVGKDRYFIVNATAICHDDNCGIVNAALRYNYTSADPDTNIPVSYSTMHPFFTDDGTNPRTCSSNLLINENCTVSFRVNASGSLNSLWKIDVQFTSSATAPNATDNASIQIGRVLVMDITFDSIDFGSLDPNTTGNVAPGNALGSYVISVDNNSNDISGGIWKMGTDLANASLPNVIGVTNMTMCTVDNYAGCNSGNRVNITYSILQNQNYVNSGTNVTSYFWIDIPSGIYAGEYAGTIYIKSNTTD